MDNRKLLGLNGLLKGVGQIKYIKDIVLPLGIAICLSIMLMLGGISPFTVLEKISNMTISITSTLLSFSLAGYTLLVGLNLISTLKPKVDQEEDENNKITLYEKINIVFSFYLLIQILTLLFSAIISILIVVFLSIVTITGLKANINGLEEVLTEKEITAPISTVLYNALKYAGFQSLVLAIMLGAGTPLTTKKSVRDFTIIGIVLNGIMITMSCLMMLVWLPLIKEETLPILTIIQQLDNNFLLCAYSITLFLAFVSTGAGCVFGIVARYENSFEKLFGNNVLRRRMILSFTTMLISMLISLLGLNTLVIKGYGYLGILSIFFLIIPTIILGIIKNRKFKEE